MRVNKNVAITLYLGGSVLLALVATFAAYGANAESSGRAIGVLLLPLIIAYAGYGRIGKRPYQALAFARLFWWASFVCIALATFDHVKYARDNANRARAIFKQAADNTADNKIDNTGKSAEQIATDARMRDLVRSYLNDLAETRNQLNARRATIEAKFNDIYQPESFTPQRAKQIIDALNENIALDNDMRPSVNKVVADVVAQVKQSGLSDSDQRDFLHGLRESIAGNPSWPALNAYLAADIELSQVSIELYQDILKGDTDRVDDYLDRIRALGAKDVALQEKFNESAVQSLKGTGLNGSEKVFQNTPNH